MKKLIALLKTSIILLLLIVSGCSKTITLDLSFGEKTGTYKGDLVDGLPNGQGSFTTKNNEGKEWTYEGSFVNGHFEGEGTIYFDNNKDNIYQIGTFHNDVLVPLSIEDSENMFYNKEDFLGRGVTAAGKIIYTMKKTDENVVYSMQHGASYDSNISYIYVDKEKSNFSDNDYVKLTGFVIGVQNNHGTGSQYIPEIQVENIELSSYIDVCAPTTKTINVNDTYTQNGYSITVEKIELSDVETRVYVSIKNDGVAEFNVYTYSSLISQNGKQYNSENNFEANYPSLQSDLRIGNETKGIIVFPKIEDAPLQVIIKGRSNNYSENFEDYIFDIE